MCWCEAAAREEDLCFDAGPDAEACCFPSSERVLFFKAFFFEEEDPGSMTEAEAEAEDFFFPADAEAEAVGSSSWQSTLSGVRIS